MSVLDVSERRAYLESPYFKKHEYGDFTPFYITVTICTVVAAGLIILNVVLGCCSRYSTYWNDRYTGNRYILSLWTGTPHKQPALDYTEIDPKFIPENIVISQNIPRSTTEFTDLDYPHSSEEPLHYAPRSSSHQQQPRFETLELQEKKESDI